MSGRAGWSLCRAANAAVRESFQACSKAARATAMSWNVDAPVPRGRSSPQVGGHGRVPLDALAELLPAAAGHHALAAAGAPDDAVARLSPH